LRLTAVFCPKISLEVMTRKTRKPWEGYPVYQQTQTRDLSSTKQVCGTDLFKVTESEVKLLPATQRKHQYVHEKRKKGIS